MSEAAQNLLSTFETLSTSEKHEVTIEILRRASPMGDISEKTFDEVAAELFQMYETEEAALGKPQAR